MSNRICGTCSLCCKLLPVVSLSKGANTKCQYQRYSQKGCCKVYNDANKFPLECGVWSCRWLTKNDTEDMFRPDRVHYVIDTFPDHLTVRDDNTGEEQVWEAVQIWCDPNYSDAHRDPKLRSYLERRAKEHIIGMVRYNSYDSTIIIAPSLNKERRWIEIPNRATNWSKEQLLADAVVKQLYEEKNSDRK